MASSSKGNPSTPSTKTFRDVVEKECVVRRLSEEAVGISGLKYCIGVYVQVTKDYCFLAHVFIMQPAAQDQLLARPDKDKDGKVERLKDKIADKLNKEIRDGLKKEWVENAQNWDVKGKDTRDFVAETLTVCYTDENLPEKGGRQLLNHFKDAIKQWAGVKEIPWVCPNRPEGMQLGKDKRKTGFVIVNPSKFSEPTWISRIEAGGGPHESHKDKGIEWEGNKDPEFERTFELENMLEEFGN